MEAEKSGLKPPRPDLVANRLAFGVMLLAVAAGAFLRFYELSDKPFWVAEIQELADARHGDYFRKLMQAGTDVAGYTWHHLMWRLGVTENLEFWHRLLAVLCGIGTIPVVYLLGRRVHSATVGAAACVMVALSFLHVNHSQDVRSQAYMTFGAALSYLGLIHVVFDRHRRWLPAYVVGTAFLALSHIFGFIVFALQSATFFFITFYLQARTTDGKRELPLRRFLLALVPGMAVAAFEVYGAAFFVFLRHTDMGGGCPDVMTMGDRLKVVSLLFTYLGGFSGAWVLGHLVPCALGGLVLWWRDRKVALVLLAWFVLPGGLLIAAKLTGRLERLDLYHLLFLLPVFAVALALGARALVELALSRLTRPPPRWVGAALLMGVVLAGTVAVNGPLLSRYFQRETKLFMGEDYRSAKEFIQERGVAWQDMLAFDYSIKFVGQNYYLGELFVEGKALTPIVPEGHTFLLKIMLHQSDHLFAGDKELLKSTHVVTFAQFERLGGTYSGTVWVVLPHEETMQELCGVASYSAWFSSDETHINVRMVAEEDIPPGFELKRFEGVDLLWKEYREADRGLVIEEVKPLLLDYAPSMADAFIESLRSKDRDLERLREEPER